MGNIEKDNRRFFIGPDEESKYFIEMPSAEDVRSADWQYSKTYTQCLIEGITTSSEMIDILTRRRIIGDDFEKRSNELSVKLNEQIAKLEETTDFDIKRELALEVAKSRDELYRWNQRLSGPMNNTAEHISDEARIDYLTSAMIVDENDKKVWSTYDAFLKDKQQQLAYRARFEVMLYLQGLDSDALDNMPESVAMREVEADILTKAEETLRTSEEMVKDASEKLKKTRKTKKKSNK